MPATRRNHRGIGEAATRGDNAQYTLAAEAVGMGINRGGRAPATVKARRPDAMRAIL